MKKMFSKLINKKVAKRLEKKANELCEKAKEDHADGKEELANAKIMVAMDLLLDAVKLRIGE